MAHGVVVGKYLMPLVDSIYLSKGDNAAMLSSETRPVMKLLVMLLMFGFGLGLNVRSQSLSTVKPFYKRFRQDQWSWNYLIKAEPISEGVFKITVKTIMDPGTRGPFYSQSIVDCNKQTLTNEEGYTHVVPREWRDTSEQGMPELYEAVCEKKPE